MTPADMKQLHGVNCRAQGKEESAVNNQLTTDDSCIKAESCVSVCSCCFNQKEVLSIGKCHPKFDIFSLNDFITC